MLNITKNKSEANLITHSGTFHPDDVFSTAFLSKIVDNPVVYRCNDVGEVDSNVIVYDIGYGKFDHHGPNARMRNEKIKYCSFGLLWEEYGKKYLSTIDCKDRDKLYKEIEERLILQIDGIDNGVFPEVNAPYKLTDLDKVIDLFNKSWNEYVDNDDNFMIAVNIASMIFDRIVTKENAIIEASFKVVEKLETIKDHILILDEYMPYSEAVFDSKYVNDVYVVIFPSNRSGYNIKPMTISKESKELLVNFPEEYRGLHDDDLKNKCGINGARFIHISGFIATADTLEDAITMAHMAMKYSGKEE